MKIWPTQVSSSLQLAKLYSFFLVGPKDLGPYIAPNKLGGYPLS
jgi:hypothetical protein